jgi:hypothetical protein
MLYSISIKNDFKVLIKRYLVKNLGVLKAAQNHHIITWATQHQFSEESKKKSKMRSLGILNFKQSTVEGTKNIPKIHF